MSGTLSTWPDFSDEEADAVAEVIRSNKVNYWTGQICRAFETEFAAWAGTRHAVALANGTLALDVSLQACGIGPGDEVIVTPRTFIASVSTVINAGARPVFADVDHDSGNISPDTIVSVLTERTAGIVPVHLAGWPCDMAGIMAIAQDRGLQVVEDCAQAHGAAVQGRMVGSWGHVGAWSFCQDKIMTTGGEGGMVTTDDEQLWSSMWSYKDHGKSWAGVYDRPHPPGYRWIHDTIGTNWRMLEMQAVLGRIQLKRIEQWSLRRQQIAAKLTAALHQHPHLVRVPEPAPGFKHAYYRLYAYLRPDNLQQGWSRDRLIAALRDAGVQVLHGTCAEVYLERAFEGSGLRPERRLPVARELGETSLMFLTHPTMSDEELAASTASIGEVLAAAGR